MLPKSTKNVPAEFEPVTYGREIGGSWSAIRGAIGDIRHCANVHHQDAD